MCDFGTAMWRKRTGGTAQSGLPGRLLFQEFQAIAPRITDKKAARAGEGSVIGNFNAAGQQGLTQLVQVAGDEGRMGLSGGAEIGLDADVELLRAAFEPAAASGAERFGLWNFREAQQRTIELAGGGFACFRSSDLDVIELCDSKGHCT